MGVQSGPARPDPAGLFNGEAVILWRLRRDRASIRCFAAEWPGAFWLAVECGGGALLSSETLRSIDDVVARAERARQAWIRQGYREE